ncbi:MAG TPA: glycosyltransferase family 9 protein [Burkholderiales bacterium]|nr:glycosyltransferase family 9 protein [Burkholderiales bacterium]
MKSILVVRRDNIGDLVCTTPLFAALRRRFPDAWLGALVNSYNAAVLERNPDLDRVIVYTKLKHLDPGQSALGTLARRAADLWQLRRRRLDCIVLATPQLVPRMRMLARALAPGRIVAFSDETLRQVAGLHEVERVFALAAQLGIDGPLPPLQVVPDPRLAAQALDAFGLSRDKLKVAVQISTRRPAQQWPAERFAELVQRLDALGAAAMLLWSPGPRDHPRHPGDDDKAAAIAERLAGTTPLVAYRAGPLPELIGALAACDAVITSDGGAMHLAAALQKPIVCFFGDVPPERWRPWGVPHRILRPESRKAADISVDEAVAAFRDLPVMRSVVGRSRGACQ